MRKDTRSICGGGFFYLSEYVTIDWIWVLQLKKCNNYTHLVCDISSELTGYLKMLPICVSTTPRYSEIFEELRQLRNESTDKPHYVNAVEEIHQKIFNYLEVKALPETQFIDESFISFLSQIATETVQTFKISEKAGLYAWARDRLTTHIRMTKRQNKDGVTIEQLRDIVEGESRLTLLQR